jgi:hypothetical protein
VRDASAALTFLCFLAVDPFLEPHTFGMDTLQLLLGKSVDPNSMIWKVLEGVIPSFT